jgi:transcriptional regulator with XRE-family HTH domain
MSKTFGRVLKYCRALGGKSQLELALDAGVSARHLSFLESGRAEPGRDVVTKLAEALDISDIARNALFAAAGFLPSPNPDAIAPGRMLHLERMLLNWDPHPSALTDAEGRVLRTNVGMRALHAALTGSVSRLLGMSAADLALGAKGFGPHLKNREDLALRFVQCRALELLIAGADVDNPRRPTSSSGPATMLFASELGALSFELVETVEGHPLHGRERALRIYSMVPSDPETEAAMSTVIARYGSDSTPRPTQIATI